MENRVIRIAHFPGSLKFGGVGSVVMNLYRNVDRNKIQFDFYVSRNEKGPFDDEVSELGGRIFYVPKIRSVGPFKYIKFIKDALMENGPYDVVHVHSAHTGVFSLISAKSRD